MSFVSTQTIKPMYGTALQPDWQLSPNAVNSSVPMKESSNVLAAPRHVVGDLHGQFWDLLHLLEMCGDPWQAAEWGRPGSFLVTFGELLAAKDPSPRNQYLFNGDFVTWTACSFGRLWL